MIGQNQRPRSIRLRSFYGFGPEEDGYLGWTDEASRDRMLELVEDGDLFLIYGAATAETGSVCRSNAVSFACFCSSLVSLAREAVKLSARTVVIKLNRLPKRV